MPALPRTWLRAAEERAVAADRLMDTHPASAAILINDAAALALRALIVRAGRLPNLDERPRHLWIDLEVYGNVPRSGEMKQRLRELEELAKRARGPSEDNDSPDAAVGWQTIDLARRRLEIVLRQVRELMAPPAPVIPDADASAPSPGL